MPTQHTVLRDLSELRVAALDLTLRAERYQMPQTAKQTRHVARYLDATRTVLVQEGSSYLDVALAIRETCASRLAAHAAWIGKCSHREPKAIPTYEHLA